jgi:hypothetical protein
MATTTLERPVVVPRSPSATPPADATAADVAAAATARVEPFESAAAAPADPAGPLATTLADVQVFQQAVAGLAITASSAAWSLLLHQWARVTEVLLDAGRDRA